MGHIPFYKFRLCNSLAFCDNWLGTVTISVPSLVIDCATSYSYIILKFLCICCHKPVERSLICATLCLGPVNELEYDQFHACSHRASQSYRKHQSTVDSQEEWKTTIAQLWNSKDGPKLQTLNFCHLLHTNSWSLDTESFWKPLSETNIARRCS
jgi:hypothetical protein